MTDTRSTEGALPTPAALPPSAGKSARGLAFKLSALGLVVVSALAGTGLARWLRPSAVVKAPAAPGRLPAGLFRGWPKPDLVIVLSGQQHGYVLPCGCSNPQVGGLERRYNFLQLLLKEKKWPYVAVDVGDVAQKRGPVALPNLQGIIKYRYSMAALKEMKYTAVALGEYEGNSSFFQVLGAWALNEPTPRVVAGNLVDADTNFPAQTERWQSAENGGLKVGVTSITSPGVADKMKAIGGGVRFSPSVPALNAVLKEMDAKKADVRVLLYQGPGSAAAACAKAYPQFSVVARLSEEDEPPANPTWVVNEKTKAKSLVVSVGRKGKFVGVVGVYKTGMAANPFELRYQLVEMSEDFLTPKAEEKDHPIVALMEEYTKELEHENYLAQYGQVPHLFQVMPEVKGLKGSPKPTYVGSKVCKRCHDDAYDVWEKSGHAKAYQALVDAKRPSRRQHDPECIVCHTVGFGYDSGFKTADATPKLKNVGCESCHGPASVHVANPKDLTWQKRINPWRHLPAKKREDAMDRMCQRCHDVDNDVTWLLGGFSRKWPKIVHKMPAPAPGN